MLRLGLIALLATPAMAQDSLPLSELMSATHVHGIGPGSGGADSLTLATHNGLWAVDLSSSTATRLGGSQDDFMGYSAVLGSPGTAFASGHPATGGNMGVIRTDNAGQSWTHVSNGLDGPVDFHSMEVSRADPAVIYGIDHDRRVQRSADGGVTWEATGEAPEKLIDIATAPRDAAMLYAATETGLFLSPDGGATWQPVIEGVPVYTVDAGADSVVRAVDLSRGLVTLSEGGEITSVSSDLPDGYLLFLATTSVDPLRLAALSAKGRLVVSQDGGASWIDALTGD
ncbi:exo-alpha-sialidase [Rhodobacter sp. SY28-1]|uniref:WD40/YVTN/BNR-like repeat-containing protein n=1 Tax=Rhodobacter sp. SY28-1 TaxID=2562317 RepID=UPI0010C05215|nr:exo-alpha-sialidase [Rhodobacter sp. SY28-1]